jgi:hypothetical protein
MVNGHRRPPWDAIDTDLMVATVLANGGAKVEGIDPGALTDSVGELIALGLPESALVTDHANSCTGYAL